MKMIKFPLKAKLATISLFLAIVSMSLGNKNLAIFFGSVTIIFCIFGYIEEYKKEKKEEEDKCKNQNPQE